MITKIFWCMWCCFLFVVVVLLGFFFGGGGLVGWGGFGEGRG